MGRRDRIRKDSGESGGSMKIILIVLALVVGIPAIVGVLVLCVIFGLGFWAAREAKKAGEELAQVAQEDAERRRLDQLEAAKRQKEIQDNWNKEFQDKVNKKKKVPANLPPLQRIPGTNMSDLIAIIDPSKDTDFGRPWQVNNGELHCKHEGLRPRLEIPYQPPVEYDYIVQFSQPKLRNGISLLMPNPTGGGFFFHIGSIKFGGPPGGSNYGIGANPMNIDKEIPGLIQPNTRYTVTVQVRRNNIRALLDDKELMNVQTDYRNLALKDWRDMRDKSVLAVDCDDPTTFHQVRVIEVTGVGKRLR